MGTNLKTCICLKTSYLCLTKLNMKPVYKVLIVKQSATEKLLFST